jgi:hypothetical protein
MATSNLRYRWQYGKINLQGILVKSEFDPDEPEAEILQPGERIAGVVDGNGYGSCKFLIETNLDEVISRNPC